MSTVPSRYDTVCVLQNTQMGNLLFFRQALVLCIYYVFMTWGSFYDQKNYMAVWNRIIYFLNFNVEA